MVPPPIRKVAIIGAGGRLGKHFANALLQTGIHEVTAISRPGSKNTLSGGVKVKETDYTPASLISALRGQQFLVITLPSFAAEDLHGKIVDAAVKAGVKWIMPNAYGSDFENETLGNEDFYGVKVRKHLEDITSKGASYIGMVCSFWYVWSLAAWKEWAFGIDIATKKATFFDDGKTPIHVSTPEQCGRALAALLSLPESGASPALGDWKNKPFYIDSFRLTQRDMLDSVHRVMGTTDQDWEISYESSRERWESGLAARKKGETEGFVKVLYSRTFFPNGGGDYGSSSGLANDILGLKKESLDEATKEAVELVNSGWNPFARYEE